MVPDNSLFTALDAHTRSLSVALGYRDPLTQLHSERVQALSGELGQHCGLSGNELDILKIAASFHDIGKIGIPDHILLKPARFDEDEWLRMRQHAEIGEKIIAAIELDGAKPASLTIRHHHEHFDGGGYPDGLAGEDIPIQARIIAIADSYDAMAETRSYHKARTHTEIMSVMNKETGRKYDPTLMRIFGNFIEHSRFKTAGA